MIFAFSYKNGKLDVGLFVLVLLISYGLSAIGLGWVSTVIFFGVMAYMLYKRR